MEQRIRARYRVETSLPAAQAAEAIAGEQSTGTFTRIPGETDELRERHRARVEEVTQVGDLASEVEISWPLSNMGPSLPNLMATVGGNLWEMKQFTALRLLDLELPPAFLGRYCGPQFGVAGTRRLCGVYDRPVIGTIIKPSVGLTPEATADIVRTLVDAGIDFIKDDELQCDGPHCPFEERLSAVMRVINNHADRTGKKVMYAANITGEIDEMLRRHDQVVAHGGTCVMVSIHSIGLAGLVELRRHCAVVIHGHRNGWGLLGRSRDISVSFVAWQKIWRLAGVDQLHCNGIANKFWESDESVVASARECLRPMFDLPGRGCEVMPVLASGQTARQAPATYAALGVTDLLFAAGGGIMGHPGGVAAGVRSLHQSWQAAVAGIPLEVYAATHPELRAALDRFQP
ncbi:MAG TPA: ribulose-bisphosphate carboxylase large subunit family protein [Bryobacteraceae bacterium]|nr:ribulose-bisphosphate carboxylase large subunit family protein [Bryobacteraceae bacterium]